MNTLIQRLLAETSPFFKKAQIAIAAILLIAFSLKAYIPAAILSDIFKYGITLIVAFSLTVTDGSYLVNDGFTLKTAMEIIAAVPAQLDELKAAFAGNITFDQAKAQAGIQDIPPVVADTQAAPAVDTPSPVAQPAVTA